MTPKTIAHTANRGKTQLKNLQTNDAILKPVPDLDPGANTSISASA